MLIDFDQKSGRLVSSRVFDESERELARKTRLDLEHALHAEGDMREVVILRAIDEAQIRRTHRRYFETLEELLALDTTKYVEAGLKHKTTSA